MSDKQPLGPDSTSREIAEHIMAEARADLVARARETDLEAHRDLARKRAHAADASLARVERWLKVALLFTALAGATLAVAAYADPVGRLAHDTAQPAYCGAC